MSFPHHFFLGKAKRLLEKNRNKDHDIEMMIRIGYTQQAVRGSFNKITINDHKEHF